MSGLRMFITWTQTAWSLTPEGIASLHEWMEQAISLGYASRNDTEDGKSTGPAQPYLVTVRVLQECHAEQKGQETPRG